MSCGWAWYHVEGVGVGVGVWCGGCRVDGRGTICGGCGVGGGVGVW